MPGLDQRAIAAALRRLAQILEIRGENPFKVRAHENAADALESGEFDAIEEARAGTLGKRKGFGEALVAKVAALAQTGELDELRELEAEVPAGLFEMLRIPGFGPKKVQAVWKKLGVTTVDELERACKDGRVEKLAGFGEKSAAKIREGIAFLRTSAGQYLRGAALAAAEELREALAKSRAVKRVEIAGSLRRGREVVKDIDIVASSRSPDKVMDLFRTLPQVAEVTGSGETKTSVRLQSGIACDLRVVRDEQFPFALMHFTGSKDHNVAMRARAQRLFNIRISEYGLFDETRGDALIPCEDEAAIHRRLGLSPIEPELREDRGEIEAAEHGELPALVTREDVRGTLHMHTHSSDGKAGVLEMAQAGAQMGFEWIGIADHSVSAFYAGGMKPDEVHRQFDEIEALNAEGSPCRILKGIECDILPAGELDYDESIWKRTDFIVGSVHSSFTMTEREMTARVTRALENPYLSILGHPTGRLLLRRDPFAIDLEAVIDAAAKHGRIIEINGDPNRLDLDWRWVKRARDAGVMLSLGPDAHRPEDLKHTWLALTVARKGWLEAKHVLNTRTAPEALKRLRKMRGA